MPDFSGYNGDLIRAGTIAAVIIKIIYGGGTDGVLTPTKAEDAEMLKAEFTVLEGEFAKRKLFASWIVKGTTDGQKSISANNAMCKRIIASALFLDPNDRTPETLAKYRIEYRDFDGLKFLAKIGIEPGRDGFEDKNVITRAIIAKLALVGQPSAVRSRPDPTTAARWAGAADGALRRSASPRGPREVRTNRLAAISADRDRWTKQAFDAGIVAAKDLIGTDGRIRPGVPIGRLTKSEWGWIVSTVVSAWVRIRSEQAASEGWNYERAAHTTGLEPDPWVQGAVASILPKLVEACSDLNWGKARRRMGEE